LTISEIVLGLPDLQITDIQWLSGHVHIQARFARSQLPPRMRPQTSSAESGAVTTIRPAATSAWQAVG
jgi:hypothetical protein